MIRFLVNPAGGRGRTARALDELERLAAAAGAPLELSESAADLTARARRAADDGVERLLVAGGDGTVHHAVAGLAGSDCALALLPLGSGNDIARSLGVPLELAAAVEMAIEAPTRRVDLCKISDPSEPVRDDPGGDGGFRLCAGVTGVGFDSAANETANRVERLHGSLIYLYAVLHTLATFKPPTFRIDHEEGRFEGGAMLVAVANSQSYGGGMRVAPQARMDDGLLDIVIVKAVSKLTFLKVFPRVYRGTHIDHPAVVSFRSPWAHVRLDRPMTVYGDGERLLPVPPDGVRFEIARRELAVVAAGTLP